MVVESCLACGLPLPKSSAKCPYCGLSPDGTGSYELIGNLDGFIWRAGCADVAVATKLEEVWQIKNSASQSSEFYLITHRQDGHTSAALLNRSLQPTTTMVFEPPANGHSAFVAKVESADGRARLAIKFDGPTGLHLIDSTGDVVLLGSAKPGPIGSGLDILLTKSVRPLMPYGIFGILVGLLLAIPTPAESVEVNRPDAETADS